MRKLLLLLLFAMPAFGQGVPYENTLLTLNSQGVLIPVTFGTITVCAGIHTEVPCTPAVTLYSDVPLTQVVIPPLISGPLGNYRFVVAPGTYSISFTGPGINVPNDVIVLAASGSANNTFTGNTTFTGNITATAGKNIFSAYNINNIVFVDGVKYTTLAAALASLPATGGVVVDTFPETFTANPFAGAGGAALVLFGVGKWLSNAQIIIPSFSMIKGAGRINATDTSGTEIEAGPSFPINTALIRLGAGGTFPTFDYVRLEDVGVDCADVTGCTGVYSDSIQENSGLFHVTVTKTKSHGVLFDMGDGSTHTAGNFSIQDLEVYPDITSASVHGLYFRTATNTNIAGVKFVSGVTSNSISGGTMGDAIRVENLSFGTFTGLHCEKATTCFHAVTVGSKSPTNLSIDNVVGSSSGNGTNIVLIDAGSTDIFLRNVQKSAGSDFVNTIQDNASSPTVTMIGVLRGQSTTTANYTANGAVAISPAGLCTAGTGNNCSMLLSSATPTISSGFGAAPSVQFSNGSSVIQVNVGTGGSASAGVIGMPTAAQGWSCSVENITAHVGNRADDTVQTASTTASVTVQNQTKSTGAALAWTASDLLRLNCMAF